MRRLRAAAALAFVLGVLAHVESLGFWFTSYDTLSLIDTGRIGSLGDLWDVFTRPLMAGTSYVEAGEFYRPVVSLSYGIEHWLWGLDPMGYHLTNLLLHGLAAVLVVLTVHALTDSRPAGALTGVLFAIHPLSVDTVPAISRRQDVMLAVFGLLALWLFVAGVRRGDDRLRVGSAVAFALALLSKETAAVVGPLAFLWVVLDSASLRRPEPYRRALVAVGPLAAVAVAYLAVRFAVLGGIGGYTHDPPASQALVFPFEYLLSLTYQAHVLGVLREFSLPLALAVVIGTPLGFLLLFGRERAIETVDGVSFGAVAVAIAGFAALSAVLALPERVTSPAALDIEAVGWYAAGTLFAVAAAALVVAALSSRSLETERRRLYAFFLAWLAMPLALFFLATQFAFRDAYFFAIPLLALLATALTDALSRSDGGLAAWSDTDAVVVLAVVVLLVPTLAASPLLYADSGWGDGGDVTRRALTGVERSMNETGKNERIGVTGIPTRLRHDPKRLGQARKVTMLQPHSLRSWLRLRGHENPVIVGRLQAFDSPPRNVSTATERRKWGTVVRIRYDHASR